MKLTGALTIGFLIAYGLFLVFSFATGFVPGRTIGSEFITALAGMARVLPCVFLLIGLFEVWVPKETVERYLGPGSSALAYGAAILLAGTAVGGIYVALPVARSLYAKGANLRVILTYLGASSVCRVPMAIFEASFLGWKFTLVRFSVSLPLLVLTSVLLGLYLERRQYRMLDRTGIAEGDSK